jgi:hypothetical protein
LYLAGSEQTPAVRIENDPLLVLQAVRRFVVQVLIACRVYSAAEKQVGSTAFDL